MHPHGVLKDTRDVDVISVKKRLKGPRRLRGRWPPYNVLLKEEEEEEEAGEEEGEDSYSTIL